MQTEHLDQRADLRLCSADADRAAVSPEPASQDREVEHQRGVGEDELGEVDDDVGLRANGPGQGWTPHALSIAVLVTAATKGRRLVVEVNDARNLLKAQGG